MQKQINLKPSIAFAMLLAASHSRAFASDITPKEGLWRISSELPAEQKAALAKIKPKITMQTRQNGISINTQAGNIILEQCLNAATLNQWHQWGQTGKMECEAPQFQQTGHHISIDVHCKQPKPASIHSEIEMSANREHYQFDHLIKAEGTEMHITGQAKRIGDCQ